MKAISFSASGSSSWRRRLHHPRVAALVAVACCAFLSVSGIRAATVDTLGGGPSQANPGSSSGFTDGSTSADSQFNLPGGVALDPAGQFMYIADTVNGAIRKLNLSGDLTTTILTGLATPVDVMVDSSTNLYVLIQGTGSIQKYDANGNFLGVINAGGTLNASVVTGPTAFAINASTNIFVVQLDGSVVRINHPTNATATVIAPAGTFSSPQGVEVLDNGTVVVSDTGNHVLRTLSPPAFTLPPTLLSGTIGTAGTNNGIATVALFRTPHHIAKAGNDVLVVADTGNHEFRLVNSAGTASLLYGVDSNVWIGLEAQFFPGWLDGTAGPNNGHAEARLPEGVAVDGGGNVYTSERFYHIIRKVTSTGLTGPGGTIDTSGGSSNVVVNPPSLSFTPNFGYFPMGTDITVSSSSSSVFFTTDGTTPTTNSTPVTMVGGTGTITWFNTLQDLTALRVAAFAFSGTNFAVTNVAGIGSPTNSVGVPRNGTALNGSTIYVPLVVNLRTNDALKSIAIHVQVIAQGGAPNTTSFGFVTTSTNDFAPVVGVSSDGNPVTFEQSQYSDGVSIRGMTLGSQGPSNFIISRFGVAAMLRIGIPAGAVAGNTYSINIISVSGTSDGIQGSIPISAGPNRIITVTAQDFLVGDTSPGRGYNTGEFGNENLDSADVNNVFLAALGIRVPFADSDVWKAMDAAGNNGSGNSGIDPSDVTVILQRSLRQTPGPLYPEAANFRRTRNAGGFWVSTATVPQVLPSRVAASVAAPGSVWDQKGTIVVPSVGNVAPGSEVTLPVTLKVAPGGTLDYAQFRASVEPIGAAAQLNERLVYVPGAFPASFTAPPAFLPISDVAVGYYREFTSGDTVLGSLKFRVPAGAQAGDSYRVKFTYLGGTFGSEMAPIESLATTVSVLQPAIEAPIVSEQWMTNFFPSGGTGSDPDDDPDGDGLTNWMEYLAGTNPNDASSHLQLMAPELRDGQTVLKLLTAPGKVYALECTTDFVNWTVVSTFTGDGNYKEVVETNGLNGSAFYRIRVQQ